ncbi:hypothetical protein [Burkholderia anthina]|uniref:hypothetical protein n=1 Tax=Burkholderia anthina TaxID=179879 RepID=UPI0037BFBBE4
MDKKAILENRDDLVDGTFCYELFELRIFNEKLFFELVDGIDAYLASMRDGGERLDQEMSIFLPWFVMGVMHCVICHNDRNDRYVIESFDMDSWYGDYEGRLSSVLTKCFALMK